MKKQETKSAAASRSMETVARIAVILNPRKGDGTDDGLAGGAVVGRGPKGPAPVVFYQSV